MEAPPQPEQWNPLAMLARLVVRRPVRCALGIGGLLIIIGHFAYVTERRTHQLGDFDVSREFGRRFLAQTFLYEGGLHYPYMPSAAMFFAPLAMVPAPVAFAARYAAALGCLWLALRLLSMMAPGRGEPGPDSRFATATLTIVLASHYIIRDLDDSGPNLMLLALLVGGIYCGWRGRSVLAATWFGLATALKAPSGLLIPFLLWKRKWRLALLTALATGFWIGLPMVWMGPDSWWKHEQTWLAAVRRGGPEYEQRIQNQALRPAIVHSLGLLPAAPEIRSSAGGDPPPAGGPARGTEALADVGAVLLLGVLAWLMRHRYRGADDPAWCVECSAVLICTLLLSPLTWVQHLVLVVPALYMVVAVATAGRRPGWLRHAAIAAYVVLAVVLNREVVGRDNYLILLTYHTHTLALLLVLVSLPWAEWRRSATAAAGAGGGLQPEPRGAP